MKLFRRFAIWTAFLILACAFVFALINKQEISAQTAADALAISVAEREEAYRANNLGVALLEQFNYKEGAEAFRRALKIHPRLEIAQTNLAIALFNLTDYDAAIIEAKKAAELAPEQPQPIYLLGLIARAQNRSEDAIAAFKRILEFDPNDVGANVNLGQILVQQRQYAEASAAFRRAFEAEPYNATALYNLATALLRSNQREEGQRLMTRFQSLRGTGAATNIGLNYLEQGRYAEAIVSTGAEKELVNKTPPKVFFQNVEIGLQTSKPLNSKLKKTGVTAENKKGAATLFDFDNDGDLDLIHLTNENLPARLFRNDNGKFTNVTPAAGDLAKSLPRPINGYGVISGDYDNDGMTDLFLFGEGVAIFRNAGKGRFINNTVKAKLPENLDVSVSAAFADADHDGDLDIFLGGFLDGHSGTRSAPNKLWRNNGDGTFTDISQTANVNNVMSWAVGVIPTDYDNRRDIDFLVINRGGKPNLFRNQRNGSFIDIAAEVGLDQVGEWFCATAGDFNKDSFVDFFLGKRDGTSLFAVSDGRGNFVLKNAPKGTENVTSAQFLDYDNDGLLDLIFNNEKGFALIRNVGEEWSKPDSTIFKSRSYTLNSTNSSEFLSGDIDNDGDIDLITFGKNTALNYFQNVGGNTNNSKIIRLQGRVSNKTGIGAKVDMRAGSLTQKLESYSASPAPAPADIHFGLGKREKPDVVRVIWTSGIIQAEIEALESKNQIAARPLTIEELDRKPSSCPYLYTWNGEKFEFITDFLGGGEMAYSHGDGQTNTPDPEEYVRITSEQLKPKNEKYELRVTNELEEVLYLDRFELIAVDHPEKNEIYPNEGLGIPTAEKFILYTTGGEKAPLLVIDGKNRNVTEKIRLLDRNFYGSFENEKIRGYAKQHELVLTLDNRRGYNGRTLLLLTGWTDYAFSSDNVAATQSGLALQMPKLQVKNKRGEWETVIESIGISVGRPQTVVVDLTGKFLSDSREVRILTNMKTLWDKIAVDTSEDATANLRVSKITPSSADLRERGFSLEIKPDGKEPILVDYETVLNDGRWKYFSGSFTRLGNVLPLLSEADDVFVISRTGDEVALTFDETALPPLEKGFKRTFLLHSAGYSKEMDINSASPDAVMPLPFRAMKKYPYDEGEQFPMTEEKRKIYDEYTTRTVKTVFPRIETALIK
ncbi:MAG TPA: FG-GAP-like repeat-containing protein [Pyrinomonadaceae bacterium]|jgi:tetratricopeptide (TPR) repeat protein